MSDHEEPIYEGMEAVRKIETDFAEYKRDFSNLLEIAIAHFNVDFAAIDIFETGKRKRIASIDTDYNNSTIGVETFSNLHIYRKPIQIKDISADKAAECFTVEMNEGFHFYASAPVYTKAGELFGLFLIMDRKHNCLHQQQMDFLQSLAKQTAVVFELQKSKASNHALKSKMEQITFKIAHDIRNPLGALKNVIELQQSGILSNKEADEMFPVLIIETNRIIELTHIVANWSSLLINNSEEQKKHLYLKYVVEEECKKSNEVFVAKKNTIINTIDESMLINANEELTRFILQQLLSNANKFTSNGTIIISANKTEDKYFIKVADNGIGISPRQLEKVNEAKEFINTKGTNKESGSGVALLLIRELLKESGKKLIIRSEAGNGTEVIVEI